jgi:hypothetical protein
MLLGAIAVAFMIPVAAEAARRDERGRQQVSQPAVSRQVVKANPAAKPVQARQAAAPVARQAAAPVARQAATPQPTRQAVTRGRAETRTASRTTPAASRGATAPSRAVAAGPRFANLQPDDMRARGYSLVMRNAAAATLPRQSAASCSRRNGRVVCAARDTQSVAGWQSGLPPADYAQRDCPAGTFATLARGHEDVVRCMPI